MSDLNDEERDIVLLALKALPAIKDEMDITNSLLESLVEELYKIRVTLGNSMG